MFGIVTFWKNNDKKKIFLTKSHTYFTSHLSFHLWLFNIVNCDKYSFKHNTSFVSRFSTIRRHKVSTPSHSHSPGIKQSGTGPGTSGCSTSTHHQGHRTLTATSSLGASSNEPMATSRIHPSVSNDSVTKEVSDASKRNSDGQWILLLYFKPF